MTDLQLSIGTPWWYIALCLLTGIVFATLLYRNFNFDHPWSRWARPLLFLLRALAVAIICFLLLTPVLKHFSYEKVLPTIVIGVDQSMSVGYALGDKQKDIAQRVNDIGEKLGNDYHVLYQSIGDDIKGEISDTFNRPATNLNQFFQGINDGGGIQSLGAVVLLSDGIFNTGASPLFEASRIKAPIYTVAVGDTTPPRDLTIRNVLHNEIGFLDDISKVQVDVQAFHLEGRSAIVNISQSGQVIQSKPLSIQGSDFFKTVEFELPLKKAGLTKYVVQVTNLPGEATFTNNVREFYIDVINSKLNIEMIAASPHPDIAAIKSVIEKNKNYDLQIHYLYQPVKLREKIDLLILFQVPTTNSFYQAFNTLWKTIQNKPFPTLFFLGGQSDVVGFNRIQKELNISGGQGSINDVYPILQSNFLSFEVKDSWKSGILSFPPLQLPFGSFIAGVNTQILMNQRIGRVETKYPLWLIGQDGQNKVGVIAGEGLWRWKLNETAKTGKSEVFDDLLNNTMRLLATREDKRKFKLATNERTYEINNNILFSGELYNDNYELINTPEVNLSVKNTSGKEFTYILDRTEKAYKLDVGRLPAGEYTYRGRVHFQGKDLASDGSFTVKATDKEMYDLVADFGTLRQISDDSKGKFLKLADLDKLVDLIQSNDSIKPILKNNRKTDPLINIKWIFGLLALLLSTEWALRKYMGRY
jgi:hypothetical protein